jgi:ribonuclease HI
MSNPNPTPPKRERRRPPAALPALTFDEGPDEATVAVQNEHRRVREAAAILAQNPTLEGLLAQLNISRWDFLIVGDGSATTWKYPGGWASVLIANSGERKTFYGGTSCLTNIVAELMAYVHPLMFLSANLSEDLVRHIHVVTDCEHLPYAAEHPQSRKKNREIWAMVDAFKYRGLSIRWHWIPRDTIDLNQFCHNMANQSRVAMKEQKTAQSLSPLNVPSVYRLSPRTPPAPPA